MSDNWLIAIVMTVSISSCTACAIHERQIAHEQKLKESPVQTCIRESYGNDARLACLKVTEAIKP